jgi:hypothetical protein
MLISELSDETKPLSPLFSAQSFGKWDCFGEIESVLDDGNAWDGASRSAAPGYGLGSNPRFIDGSGRRGGEKKGHGGAFEKHENKN